MRRLLLSAALLLAAGCATTGEPHCTDLGNPFGVPDSLATVAGQICLRYNPPQWGGFQGARRADLDH